MEEIKQQRKKKENELMDIDNSVVTMRGKELVEVEGRYRRDKWRWEKIKNKI